MDYSLVPRDPFAEAKDTLSSWDKCMAKTYCKWPVIVGIVVGSLIILSVVLCVARCICCGAELACCCFKCCTCCCPSSSRGHKRVKSDPNPGYGGPNPYAAAHSAAPPAPMDNRPFNQQYRSHATPAFNHEPERPQFATFESQSKPVNEDALPAMPSWKEARSVHVEEEVIPEKRGDMEMDRLDHNGSTNGSVTAAAAVGTRRSPGPGRSPVHRSPTQDSYGFPPGHQNDSFVSAAPQRSPHNSPGPYGGAYGQQQDGYRRGSPAQGYGPPQDDYRRGSPAQAYGQQQDGYRVASPAQSRSPVYAAGAGYSTEPQYGRQSPRQDYDHYDQYDQYSQAPSRSPPPSYGYGAPNGPANSFAPAPRSNTPGYASSTPVGAQNSGYAPSYEPANASYPGQQSYEPTGSAYPGQTSYQAFNPGQTGQQYSGVTRKAIDGSWKEV